VRPALPLIRTERAGDQAGVRAVNVAAFETPAEADLVDALRARARPLVSLVAEDAGAIVGHILFSPVTLPGHPALALMGLAPMAVAPPRQRSGIGSGLVHAGLEACRRLPADVVVVLGHPEYYPLPACGPASAVSTMYRPRRSWCWSCGPARCGAPPARSGTTRRSRACEGRMR
jgi:putative acetyltransferase